MTGAAARQKRPIYSPDVLNDPQYVSSARSTRSELAIPLMVRDEVVGVLDCQSENLHHFDNDKIDRWNMYACNCTSFAAWALERNGQRTDWFVAGKMDAHNWPSVARRKALATGGKPRVGSIAAWPKLVPPWGHLAYVTRLDGDGRFDVAEYNLLVPYGFDRRTEVSPAGVTFVYVPYRRT